MKRKGISPTKVILAIIATGAVYKVGTFVTEPPKGPPAPPPTTVPTAAETSKVTPKPMSQEMAVEESAKRMKAQQQQMKIATERLDLEKKLNGGHALPKDDGISPDYFKHVTMGKTGFDENAKQEAKVKRITDEVNKHMAPIVASVKPVGAPMGVPVPPSGPTSAPPASTSTSPKQ